MRETEEEYENINRKDKVCIAGRDGTRSRQQDKITKGEYSRTRQDKECIGLDPRQDKNCIVGLDRIMILYEKIKKDFYSRTRQDKESIAKLVQRTRRVQQHWYIGQG